MGCESLLANYNVVKTRIQDSSGGAITFKIRSNPSKYGMASMIAIHDKQEVGEPFVGYIKKSVYNNSMYMYMIVIMATLATNNNSKEQFIEY